MNQVYELALRLKDHEQALPTQQLANKTSVVTYAYVIVAFYGRA
jgi:hypothetical protein